MKKILVWDLPTRLFHWAFAILLTLGIVLALVVDEDSPAFQWHMLCGLAAVSLLPLRVIYGLLGPSHSRFSGFPVGPRTVAAYVIGVLRGTARRFIGHNPGSATAALAMFLLVPAIVLTGIGAEGELAEDLHGALAYALMAVIGLHLAGLALHTLRHKENIAASMVTGRKEGNPEQGLPSARPAWALAFLLAAGGWFAALLSGHDARRATVRLPGLGTVIELGEPRSEGKHRDAEHHDRD